MTLRIALLGAGTMGSDHARIFAEDIPSAKLQVICDASEQVAGELAADCSVSHIETDPLEAIRRNDVDAVVIASPDNTHAALTLAALRLQKPVLCEKPLAATAAECRQVIEAECSMGRQLVQVGFMRRYDPAYQQMKSTHDAGTIGTPLMMHNFHRNVSAPEWFSGRMAITNSAPHEFDVVHFILNSEITAISVFEPNIDCGLECMPLMMLLETSGGQLASVEVNNNARYGYDVRGELVGSAGSVSLGSHVPITLDENLRSVSAYPADWRSRFAEAYRLQNKAWVKAVLSGQISADAANAWDGYMATRVALAGIEALQSGQKVTLATETRPSLYRQSGYG